MLAPVGTLLGVGLAWGAVAWADPGDGGASWCPFRTLTGLDGPFCGATRACAALGRGDLVGALDHNAYLVLVVLPLALVGWVVWARRAWRGEPFPLVATRLVLALMGLTAVWWVLRLAVPWLGSAAG
jgi:hypothetical protein